jgi:3-oxoadipate enol-lactonase
VRFERDGVALNVLDEGRGEPIVLLHGHTLDLSVWDDLAGELVRTGYRAIRYDQRGHGLSASPACGYRLGDHATDLAALLDHLGATPAHVVGLSKGGAIALEQTLRGPAAVRSLILVAPLVPDFPLSAELTDSFRALARAVRSDGVSAAVRAHWLSHPLIASAYALPHQRSRVEAMILGFPAGEYLASTRDAPDRDWTVVERLGEIAVPALVVSGERDVPDFVAMASLVADRVPGCVLEVVPKCGHLVPLERPEALSATVREFLASLPR